MALIKIRINILDGNIIFIVLFKYIFNVFNDNQDLNLK